jgi:hypothetical protein
MSTSEHTVTTGAEAPKNVGEGLMPKVGPECHQCGGTLDYAGTGKGDRGWSPSGALRGGTGRPTIFEHVRCPACGAGGTFVKLAENDRIVRRFGPATRELRGSFPSARAAENAQPVALPDGGQVAEQAPTETDPSNPYAPSPGISTPDWEAVVAYERHDRADDPDREHDPLRYHGTQHIRLGILELLDWSFEDLPYTREEFVNGTDRHHLRTDAKQAVAIAIGIPRSKAEETGWVGIVPVICRELGVDATDRDGTDLLRAELKEIYRRMAFAEDRKRGLRQAGAALARWSR